MGKAKAKKRGKPTSKKKIQKKPVSRKNKKIVRKPAKQIGRRAKRIKKREKKARPIKRVIPASVLRSRDLTYIYPDKDTSRWLILELYDDLSLETIFEEIENNVVSIFGEDTEFYIPVYYEQVKETGIAISLFEGYVFIKEDEKTNIILGDMRSEYIRGPLLKKGEMQYVSAKDINKFKKDLQKKIKNMMPRKNQKVTVRVGVFKDMEGKVLSVDKKQLTARLRFEKASRIVEAHVSVINLERKS